MAVQSVNPGSGRDPIRLGRMPIFGSLHECSPRPRACHPAGSGGRRRDNEPMLRRPLLAAAGALLLPASVPAQTRPRTGGPLRLGVDRSLADSGLAPGLQRAFSADTGIAVRLEPGPALAVLEAVTNGEVDAALMNAPEAEGRIAQQNLVHDRRLIARGEFVIVGPAQRSRGRVAPPPSLNRRLR